MPTLKQLTCHVEWTPSDTPFREYGIGYGDGVVESYIAIPAGSTPFSISLRSDGFIAPGLAMFVFIDGVYQCNRYRGDLQNSNKLTMDCLSDTVNFRVRQMEEHLPDGGWIGRPWRFEPLNIDHSVNDASLSSHFQHLGTIHVLVLRCLPDTAASRFDLECPTSPESATAVMSDDETFFTQSSHGQTKHRDRSVTQVYAGFDGPSDNPYYEPRQGRPHNQFRHSKSSARDGRSKSRRKSGAVLNDDWNQPMHKSDWADVPVRKERSANNRLGRGQPSESTTSSDVSCQAASSRRLDTRYASDIDSLDSVSTAPNRSRIARSQNPYTPGGTPIVVNINPMLSPEPQVTQSRGRGFPDGSIKADRAGHGHVGPNRDQGNREYNIRRRYRDSERDHEYQYGRQEKRQNMRHRDIDPASSPEDVHSKGHRQHDGRDSEWDTNPDMDHGADNNSPSTGWKPHDESSPPTSDNGGWDNNDPQITQSDDTQSEKDADPFSNNGAQEGSGWGQTDTNANLSPNESWPKEGGWQPDTANSSEGHDWDNNQDINQDTTSEKQHHVHEHTTTSGVGTWSSSGDNQQDTTRNNTADPMNNHGLEAGRLGEQDTRILRETPMPWQSSGPFIHNATQSPAAIRSPQTAHSNNSMVLVSPLATGSDGHEPALYTVPVSVAQSGLLSHQVQLGSATEYAHKIRQPAYIDNLEYPYAKFIFNYRTQGAIEQLLGIKIERNIDEERRQLESVSKEELIARILRTERLSSENPDIPRKYQGGPTMPAGGNIRQPNTFETRGPHYQSLNRPAVNPSGNNGGHFGTTSKGRPPGHGQNSTESDPFLMSAASNGGNSSNMQAGQGSWERGQPDGSIQGIETSEPTDEQGGASESLDAEW